MATTGNEAHANMIAEVEAALARLLDPATPAPEKAHVEQQLGQLKAAPHACLPVLYELLRSSSSEYALWFAATALEEYVARQWTQLQPHEQLQLRQFAWEFLLTRTSVAFVERKLRKVVADVARLEWKDGSESGTWPEFLSQVEALVVDSSTRTRGLELLRVVVDEFGRDDALAFAAVKRQAKAQLVAQLPRLLPLLSTVLQGCNERLQQLQSPASGDETDRDHDAHVALETLTHLLTWAPVAELLTEAWITLLFDLSVNWHRSPLASGSSVAALECLTELVTKRFAPTAVESIVEQIMRCLCPLLQQTVDDRVMGRASETYLDKLSAFVEAFLTHHLTKLERVAYEAVLPDFLQLVLTLTVKQPHVDGFLNCLSVWEVFVGYIEDVEMNEGASNDHVRRVLDVYEHGLVGVMLHLLERVNYATNRAQLEELSGDDDDDDDDSSADTATANDSNGGDSSDAFDLESSSSDRIYGTGSLQDLAQLSVARTSGGNVSDAASGALELSDRKQFVVDCIALIRRIAAFPACAPPLLERLLPTVQETCANVVFRLHETPAFPPHSNAAAHERRVVRDLTTNCAVLASVCAQFYSTSEDMGSQMAGWQILHLFISLADYLVAHRLATRGGVFIALECEALTSVRFCLSCVPFVVRSGARQDVLDATERVLRVLLTTLDTSIVPAPQVVMQNAMQLLANLGFVLSYDDLACVPSMAQLERTVHQFSLHLPLAIQGDLYTSMANSILNSAISLRAAGNGGGAAANEAAVQRWGEAYGQLLLPVRESLEQSALTLQQNEHRVLERGMVAQIQRDCYLVRCLARAVELKPKVAKDAFFAAYQSAFPSLLSLLTTYVGTIRKAAAGGTQTPPVRSALRVVNEIVRLYAQLLKSIRKEMHKESVAELMRVFVEIFSDAQLTAMCVAVSCRGVAWCGVSTDVDGSCACV